MSDLKIRKTDRYITDFVLTESVVFGVTSVYKLPYLSTSTYLFMFYFQVLLEHLELGKYAHAHNFCSNLHSHVHVTNRTRLGQLEERRVEGEDFRE